MNDFWPYLCATVLFILFYGEPNLMSGLVARAQLVECTP